MQEQHWVPLNTYVQRLLFLLVMLSVVPGCLEMSWSLRRLPCEISTFAQSQSFTCSNRKLGAVPDGIGWNATQLDLSFNKIKTLFDDSFFNLRNLTLLDLKFNRISVKHYLKTHPLKISHLTFSHLDQLKVLLLDGNSLTTVPQGLPPGLWSLSLSHNNIQIVSHGDFSDIVNIRSIRLHDNCDYGSTCKGPLKITNKTFSHLTHLTNLTLSYNRLKAIPPFLPPSLLMLKLKLNAISHIYQIDLNYLVNLQVLDMSGNCPVCSNTPFFCVMCKTPHGELQIHPDAFSTLSQLQELRLSGNSLRSIQISWFQNLTSLQYLYLSFNSLIGEMSTGEFPSVLPLVEVMDLSYNTDLSYSHQLVLSENFSKMASLKTLHLESYVFSALHEQALKPLYNLPNLSVINLGTNFLQKVNLSLFARFNNLSIIDLSENVLSFLSPSPNVCGSGYSPNSDRHHFGPNIHTDELYRRFPPSVKPECRVYGPVLDLSRNSIITINPKQLHGLENITCLNLSSNSIREMFNGTEFVHFPKLKYLDLAHNKIYLRSDLAFSELRELEVLDLSHNSHYFVLAGLNHSLMFLEHLSHLKTLNLSWNEIYTLTNKTMSSKSLQELIFQGNCLDLMWNGDIEGFYRLFTGLTNLTSLDLSLNKLGNIPIEVYNYFPTTLRHLDLSKNKLKAFEWKMLKRLPQLQKLDLSKNHLDFVANHLSKETRSLRLLDLSHNRISELNPGFLRGASSLWFLDLSFNLLELLNQTTFESGVENHLQWLSLEGNPLHCTCDLLDFHLWMMDNDVQLPLLATAVMCDLPAETRGQSVLNDNIEACIRDEKAIGIFIATSLPVLLILLVSLTAHLFYWDLSYMLEYCGAKLKYHRSQTTGCVYDAFIMYDTASSLVSEWVLNHLRLELEERGERICLLCLEERDWPPGVSIMENLSYSVQRSRKTVFVMTEGFLSRGVVRMAALLVQQRLVEEGLDVMVLLLLDPTVLRRSRILHLRRRLCGRSVLEWPGPTSPAAQHWFWHRLRRAIQKDQKGTHTALHSTYFTGS